jgi:hypothetical protein
MTIQNRLGFPKRWAALLAVAALGAPALRAENVITMGYGEGNPGDRDIDVIVTATNDTAIHGYSIAFTYPSDVLSLSNISTSGTQIDAAVSPDFVAPSFDNRLGVGSMGVIFSFREPVTRKELPSTPANGFPRMIARLTFNVNSSAIGGVYPITLQDGIGTPASYNRFTAGGTSDTSITPRLVSGQFVVKGGGNILALDKAIAIAGATQNLTITARSAHPTPLDGFQIAIRFDRNALKLNSATFSGTSLGVELGGGCNPPSPACKIEVYNFELIENFSATESRATVAALFDYFPIDGHQLSAAPAMPPNQGLIRFSFQVNDVADDQKQWQDITLDTTSGVGLLDCRFIVGDRSLGPDLNHGKIYFSEGTLIGKVVDSITGQPVAGIKVLTDPDGYQATTTAGGNFRISPIAPGQYGLIFSGNDYYPIRVTKTSTGQDILVAGSGADTDAGTFAMYKVTDIPPKPFIRGYVNRDSQSDLSDAIALLNYLFQGGEKPRCLLAADVNDDNKVDISDSVYFLNYLFTGGGAPPQPTAETGCMADPTPGVLTSCNEFNCP